MVKKRAQKIKESQTKPNMVPLLMAAFAFLFIAGKSYQLTRSLPKTLGIIVLATLPLIVFQKKFFN